MFSAARFPIFLLTLIVVWSDVAMSAEISRADMRVLWEEKQPRAVLILCPGQNGSGEEFLKDAHWRDFAQAEKLSVVVPHFVSPDDVLRIGHGYFVASRGSGRLLLEFLSSKGWENVPLFLYGFSGGAHFSMSFAAFAPERVLGFAAYSFSWFTPPPAALQSPALIACGQKDGLRYGASFAYFQAGRTAAKPWAWISLADKEHDRSRELEAFARDYLRALLKDGGKPFVCVDNTTRRVVNPDACAPMTTSLIPASVLEKWQGLHVP